MNCVYTHNKDFTSLHNYSHFTHAVKFGSFPGSKIPDSVIMPPVMRLAGVISNAGFHHPVPSLAILCPLTNSIPFSERSIGISFPVYS